jgi:phosphoglucosamine mutase
MNKPSQPKESSQKLFGTDGIRGIAGEFPLDPETVETVGRSLARNLASELGRSASIVIGRDTRQSGPDIERAVASGSRAEGAHVESAGVITTPGVAYIARSAPFDAGVVISASHNPYLDNGIKVFSPTGRKLNDAMERKIEDDIARIREQLTSGGRLRGPASVHSGADNNGDAAETHARHSLSQDAYRERYIEYLVKEVAEDLKLTGVRMAVDCANGAASEIAPQVFRRLGAEVTVLSADPNGRNINEKCGSLHPDTVQRTVVDTELDLGVAFDGDADRVLFVDERGALVDGDNALLILAEYMKSRNLLREDVVVSTVMSNMGLEIALRDRGIGMIRTAVGDRYVLEELIARNASLGGEQSGHIIFPDISLAGDGIITAIEMLRASAAAGTPLSALASRLTRFPQVLVNVRVRSKPEIETIPEVRGQIGRIEEEMNGRGRLLVRYSGTENLARVMIEGEDQERIETQANDVAQAITNAIGA